MIIVSQDKRSIYNFNNVKSIDIVRNEIYITDDILADSGACIAKYTTEERAKEVLQEVIKRKALFELFKTAPKGGREQTEMLEKFAQNNIIFDTYEMPKELI